MDAFSCVACFMKVTLYVSTTLLMDVFISFKKKKRGWRIKKKGGEVKEWPDSWATSHFCAFGRVNKSTSIFGSINLIELLRQATGGDVAARDALPVNAHTQGRGSFVFPPLFFFCVCVLKLVDFLFLG